MLLVLAEPVDSLSGCPSSLSFGCTCAAITDETKYDPSGSARIISCGDYNGDANGTMTDDNLATLIGEIPTTVRMDALGIYYQPSITKVPSGLSKFTYLVGVYMYGNGITSVNAADLAWPWLREIDLYSNAIASISGDFNLTYPFRTDKSGIIYVDLSSNAITSLSATTFTLFGDDITLDLSSNSINKSVSGDAFTFSATQSILLDLSDNQIPSVSGKFNLTATDVYGEVELHLEGNSLTSLEPATFYLYGPDAVQFYAYSNSLTSVDSSSNGQITLKSVQKTFVDLSYNQLTSVKLAPDTNPPFGNKQTLHLYNNNLTGTIDCNDLGINNGTAAYYLSIHNNQISGAKCGAGTLLDSANKVEMDWYQNSFTSLPAGALNFTGTLRQLDFYSQNTAFTYIAPGALPSESISQRKLIILMYLSN